ncbi:hypothetical protein AOQ84DRAFT_357926 [Glonium stellatum]|uniref:Uncharacterized protein n=1 Tax=Glonium stellatum TaxID=574774 RepID=A0A8E2EMB0_9PEZI|nr:hypothetical protein AOQ84DRAFT_357926 [Glonium stellatum]
MASPTPITKTTSNRLPAPSLFVGPPSCNASNTSLLPPPTTSPSTRTPLVRQRSLLADSKRSDAVDRTDAGPAVASGPFARRQQQQQQQVEQQSNERTDAIWAEMQNTLEEVELSATSGTHVFAPAHSRALDELRTAQIALAEAWARSEADEEGQGEEERAAAVWGQEAASGLGLGASDILAADHAEKLAGVGASAAAAGPKPASERTQLEEDTEKDIELSRKRREVNDRYFQRVNAGVLEVVAKLEEVAKAMKGVEQESKEMWRDGESIDTTSVT